MLKRLVALVAALALVIGTIGAVTYESKAAPYEGSLSVNGAQITTKVNSFIYLKGTDSYLAGGIEDWDSPFAILKANSDDADSGIWVNDTKKSGAFLKKYNGTHNYYFAEAFGGANSGDIVTIKGRFYSQDGVAEVYLTESKFQWNGSQWLDYVERTNGSDYKETLSYVSGDHLHMYFSTKATEAGGELMPDENWELALLPINQSSGTYLNGTRLENGYMKKVTGGNWYTGELNAKAGDVFTVKGTFGYSDNGHTVTIEELNLRWDGVNWVPHGNVTSFSGSLSVVGAEITTTNSGAIYLKGTDGYLADYEQNWDLPEVLLKADPSDAEGGIFINDTKVGNGQLKKYWGKNNFYYAEPILGIKKDDIVTIKGAFHTKDGSATVEFTESKFQWDGSKWVDYKQKVVGNLYKETLAFSNGEASYMYLQTKATEQGGQMLPDINWEQALYPQDDNSGLFINGQKLASGYMKKIDAAAWYTGELNAKSGDELVIKGTFGYSENGHSVLFEEIKMTWDGLNWTEHFDTSKIPCENITIKKLHNVSCFLKEQNMWKLYLEVDGTLPGEIDITHFQGTEVEINGTVYKYMSAHSHEDTLYLGISGDIVPEFPDENVKIVIKAGKYITPDKMAGISIKKDFTLYINEYGLSDKKFLKPFAANEKNVKLTIDRDRGFGGNENGIYLLTEDKFPVDETWATFIRGLSYDENSGVFYNDKKIESLLKKFEDGRIYVDLLSAGITAKDKDKVTVKGNFYLDDYGVSYKEYTLHYNGKAWNETYFKQKVTYTKITAESIHPVTWYNDPTNEWKVYVRVDGKLPGSQDAMSFEGLEIIVDGKKLDTLTHHSHEGCLYFGIPSGYLKKNPKDGIKITIKAGKAIAANRIDGIKLTKDFTFYTYLGGLTSQKPTKNTKWQDITITGTPGVQRYSEPSMRWNLFFNINIELETEHATQYLKLPVYLNGKKVELTAAKENEYLFVWIPEDVLPQNAGPTTFTIKKGASAIANAGRNGFRIAQDYTLYLYNGVWSIHQFDEPITTDVNLTSVQNAEYMKGVDGNNHWNIYLWADSKIPCTAWYEQFIDFTVSYNGKEFQTILSKAYSNNSRLMHFPLRDEMIGKAKEGDIVTIKPQTVICGGYEITFKKTFELIFKDGVWSEYVKSKVKEPKDDKSLWEIARFDSSYIPFTERGYVTFSSSDKYNRILSTEDMKDYTVSFKSTKLTDNTVFPAVSVVLRGNQIDDETPMSTTTLYGYVVQFKMESEAIDEDNVRFIGCVNIWKNGRKDGLVDAYRIAYARDTENPFYWFNESYDYEFSIYNVTKTCVCITVKVNDKVVLRCYDEASDDPKDPAVNAGKFGVFAEDTSTIYDDIYECEEVFATATSCTVGEAVWVAGSYPYVSEKTAFRVDSENAKANNGVFKATEPGEYNVSCTYDGKELKPITITVNPAEEEAVDNQIMEEDTTGTNWLLIGILAGAVLLAGIAVISVIIIKGKKKKSL